MDSYVPLVISFTPGYIVPALTLLNSVLQSSDAKYRFHIYVMTPEELSEERADDFLSLDRNRLRLTCINLKESLKGIYINKRFSEAAYYRLILSSILKDLDKVIYIDCDIIVRQDIGWLFENTNIGENYYAGVVEATLESQMDYLQSIGCLPGSYINSGFLIINLKQLREDNLDLLLLERSNDSSLEFPDQDSINIICANKIVLLKPIYNSIRTYFLPQYRQDFLRYYSLDQWEEVNIKGNIHYTGGKPWESFTIQFDTWWSYYQKLPQHIINKYRFHKEHKLYYFFLIYRFGPVKCVIEFLRNIYRRVNSMNRGCYNVLQK